MATPVKFVAKNWLSIKECEHYFHNGAWQIKGKNLDEPDQDPNGSGKSAFQHGIKKCITGQNDSDERDKEMVMYGEKEAFLYISLKCPYRNSVLEIERTVSRKSSESVKITDNGEVKYKHSDKMTKEANKYILEWLDLSKEDLESFYIVSKDDTSFFSMKNAARLEMISRFSGADKADKAIEKVKKDISAKEAEITLKNSHISTTEALIESKEQDIEREKQSSGIKEQVEAIMGEISALTESIKETEKKCADETARHIILKGDISVWENNFKKLSAFKYDISELNMELEDLNKKRFKFEDSLKKLKADKELNDNMVNETLQLLKEIENSLAGTIKCPECSHEFVLGKDIDVAQGKESKMELEEIILHLNADTEEKEKAISEYREKHIKPFDEKELGINAQIREKRKKKSRLSSIMDRYSVFIEGKKKDEFKLRSIISNLGNEYSFSKSQIVLKEKSIASLEEDQKENKRLTEMEDDLYRLNKKLKAEKKQLESMEEEMRMLNLYLINFKSFKLRLAKRSIKVIQSKCNEFLKNMKSDMRVSIEGFKEKADGTFKEEITPYIIRDGRIRSFESFSKGERGKLLYSGLLTMQCIVNDLSRYGGLTFLMADEAINGLGSNSLDTVTKSMEDLGFPVYVTSHIQSGYSIEKCLVFVKEKGISKIEIDKERVKLWI